MSHRAVPTPLGGADLVKCAYCGTAGQWVPYNRRRGGANGRYVWGSDALRLVKRETPAPAVQPNLFEDMPPVDQKALESASRKRRRSA